MGVYHIDISIHVATGCADTGQTSLFYNFIMQGNNKSEVIVDECIYIWGIKKNI